jgi:excisionase family DNA binding protein
VAHQSPACDATVRGCIEDAARITGVPSGTIRRWLAEGRLTRYGDHKPYRVDYDEIMELRKLLDRSSRRGELA